MHAKEKKAIDIILSFALELLFSKENENITTDYIKFDKAPTRRMLISFYLSF